MRLALQRHHALAQLAALRVEHRRVDQHAVALDALQQPRDRHLDAPVHVEQAGVFLDSRPQRLVHVQGHLAVFARVLGGAAELDLGERNLVGALAAHVLVAQPLAAEVPLGEAFQAVRLVRLEHIALQHGVVLVPARGDAGAGEHLGVVLDVLPDLGRVGVLQPRLQPGQHLVERQLIGCAGVAVGERDVGRLAGRDGERDADDACRHRVERIGLGVDGGERRGLDLRHPGVEHLARQHRVVVAFHRRGRRRGRQPARGDGLVGAHLRLQLALERLEAVAVVEREQAVAVDVAHRERSR